jgi:hypothetical protein
VGCAHQNLLPLKQGYADDRTVDYVTTDASTAFLARKTGGHHVPLLARALGRGDASLTDRVYMFAASEQWSVFASRLGQPGYSPLWRVVWVRWRHGFTPRQLTSEEQLLAAEQGGELVLELSNDVINCPIVGEPHPQPRP